jgi:phenylpropionate dioxygenase-like ring-hydroxylating dioxygenase large terminal subunit
MLILPDYWYIAAPCQDLARKPIRRLVEGEPLVLFRDTAGKPHALRDRCAHRGMPLSCGRVIEDCIECPYHGWRYDGAGAVRAVPALCEGEPLPQPKTMRAYPVVERDEHLWVWLGEDEPAEPPFHFPRCGEPSWSTFFLHTRFEAPVEACLENFLDVPHTLLVHPGLFRGKSQRPTRARVRLGGTWVEAEFLDEQPMQGLGPRLMFPRDTVMRHTDRFLLPSISRVDYTFGDQYAFLITSQCTQREAYRVDVTTAITWRLPVPTPLARPFLKWYCRRVIRQDVDVLKLLGQQIERFGQAYASTAADLLGSHIRGLRRQAAQQPRLLSEAPEACEETVLMI